VRRSLALGAVWVVAAALAAGVAWAGIGVVGDQVTDDRPPPLSADEIARAVEVDSPGDTTDTRVPAPGGSTTTTNPGGNGAATTETYRMVGGVVTLRFTPAGVTVLGATPNQGFTVDSEPEHGNGVKVEFESDGHESRIDGWWDGGPQVRRQEDGQDVAVDDDNSGPGSDDDGGDDGGGDDGPG
jgi:hypothetical protein